ncbi:hypothetical protein FDECE_8595 [Fusarium decemcellulare]|nr:hypothetical protein FDECE_8595 [Fusarium decemcellulare]
MSTSNHSHDKELQLENQPVPDRADSNSAPSDTTNSQSKEHDEADQFSDIPDGGLVAWLCVFGVWCTSFCSYGWISSIGSFQQYYQNVLLPDYTPSQISWIPSLQIFFMMALGPVVGKLYDHYGPHHMMLIGSFLHVFGLMMASLGTEYYQLLLAQGACSAIGVSTIFQPALNTLHGWFHLKKGVVFGIVSTGSSVGGIIFPIMVSRMIERVGFPWAMRTCAFVVLVLLVIANLTVRNRIPPHPQKTTVQSLWQPFKETEFTTITIGTGILTYGIFIPINYLPAQAFDMGMDPKLTEYVLAILNAGSLFGRIASGLVGDKIGRYNIFIIVCYLSALWTLALWIPASNSAAIVAFAVLFGFSSGAYVSLLAPLVAQISPPAEIGFRSGLVFSAESVGGLTTNPISGAIREGPLGWQGTKIFAGVLGVVGTTFILAARIHRTGFNLLAKF